MSSFEDALFNRGSGSKSDILPTPGDSRAIIQLESLVPVKPLTEEQVDHFNFKVISHPNKDMNGLFPYSTKISKKELEDPEKNGANETLRRLIAYLINDKEREALQLAWKKSRQPKDKRARMVMDFIKDNCVGRKISCQFVSWENNPKRTNVFNIGDAKNV
tara:strand:+ start:685 stop:1167 length:483 start_codon:yes stop_codon:yes gene_type:complete